MADWDSKAMGQSVDKERLIELLEPAVAALGYELTDIDAHCGRRGLRTGEPGGPLRPICQAGKDSWAN